MPVTSVIEAMREEMRRDPIVFIMGEDGGQRGGVGAEVAALVADEAFEYQDGPVIRLCGPDVPTMPFAQSLEDAYMPTTERIAEALRQQSAY